MTPPHADRSRVVCHARNSYLVKTVRPTTIPFQKLAALVWLRFGNEGRWPFQISRPVLLLYCYASKPPKSPKSIKGTAARVCACIVSRKTCERYGKVFWWEGQGKASHTRRFFYPSPLSGPEISDSDLTSSHACAADYTVSLLPHGQVIGCVNSPHG